MPKFILPLLGVRYMHKWWLYTHRIDFPSILYAASICMYVYKGWATKTSPCTATLMCSKHNFPLIQPTCLTEMFQNATAGWLGRWINSGFRPITPFYSSYTVYFFYHTTRFAVCRDVSVFLNTVPLAEKHRICVHTSIKCSHCCKWTFERSDVLSITGKWTVAGHNIEAERELKKLQGYHGTDRNDRLHVTSQWKAAAESLLHPDNFNRNTGLSLSVHGTRPRT
jgi:hypothetical protein